jgi:hypothetical protein
MSVQTKLRDFFGTLFKKQSRQTTLDEFVAKEEE